MMKWSLQLTRGENSRDSHSFRYRCKVANSRLLYEGPRGKCERGQCEHKKVDIPLDKNRHRELVRFFTQHGPFSDFQEVHQTELTGDYVQVRLEQATAGSTAVIRIAGMTNAWIKSEVDPKEGSFSREATALLKKAALLRRQCTKIAREHDARFLR